MPKNPSRTPPPQDPVPIKKNPTKSQNIPQLDQKDLSKIPPSSQQIDPESTKIHDGSHTKMSKNPSTSSKRSFQNPSVVPTNWPRIHENLRWIPHKNVKESLLHPNPSHLHPPKKITFKTKVTRGFNSIFASIEKQIQGMTSSCHIQSTSNIEIEQRFVFHSTRIDPNQFDPIHSIQSFTQFGQ